MALSDLKAADGKVSQTKVAKAAEYAMRLAAEKKFRDVAFALSQALQKSRKEHKLAFLYAIDATLSMEKKATKEVRARLHFFSSIFHTATRLTARTPVVKGRHCTGLGKLNSNCSGSGERGSSCRKGPSAKGSAKVGHTRLF